MARDPHDAVAGDAGHAPRMFRQPSDAPPPLGRLTNDPALQSFRREWSARRTGTAGSFRRAVRAWAGRVSGRSDRRLLLALASATDAVAAQCDHVVDRLTTQEAVGADVARVFGEEIAQLRAEVLHLQRVVASLQGPPR
jgi:hypothetical protein